MGRGQSRQVQVRWPDLDSLGHVNHATVLVYLEVGRDTVLGERGVFGQDYVVRRCEIDYISELRPTGTLVEYRCDRLTLGTKSITTTEHLIDEDGTIAVTASFTLVMWDAVKRASRLLTAEELEKLSDLKEETS